MPRFSIISNITARRTVSSSRPSYALINLCLFFKFSPQIGRCFPDMRHASPGTHLPHGYNPSWSLVPLLKHYTPVYTYTITYRFQPQKLATPVWYVLAPSAAALFAHYQLTSQEPCGTFPFPCHIPAYLPFIPRSRY